MVLKIDPRDFVFFKSTRSYINLSEMQVNTGALLSSFYRSCSVVGNHARSSWHTSFVLIFISELLSQVTRAAA